MKNKTALKLTISLSFGIAFLLATQGAMVLAQNLDTAARTDAVPLIDDAKPLPATEKLLIDGQEPASTPAATVLDPTDSSSALEMMSNDLAKLDQQNQVLTQKNSDLSRQISALTTAQATATIAWYQEPTFVLVLGLGAVIFLVLCVLLMLQNKKLQSTIKLNQGSTPSSSSSSSSESQPQPQASNPPQATTPSPTPIASVNMAATSSLVGASPDLSATEMNSASALSESNPGSLPTDIKLPFGGFSPQKIQPDLEKATPSLSSETALPVSVPTPSSNNEVAFDVLGLNQVPAEPVTPLAPSMTSGVMETPEIPTSPMPAYVPPVMMNASSSPAPSPTPSSVLSPSPSDLSVANNADQAMPSVFDQFFPTAATSPESSASSSVGSLPPLNNVPGAGMPTT